MRLILLGLMLIAMLGLTSCGAITGTIDFGFIKIPAVLILVVIVFFIIRKRMNK